MKLQGRPYRAVISAVAAGALAATALAACGSSNTSHAASPATAAAAATPATGGGPPAAGLSAKALALHDAMRAAWETHGQYTEMAIVDAVSGNPETNDVVARLQQNQVDIGNAIAPYYGAAAGTALTDLLHQHISTAVAAVVAAKSGNSAATNRAVAAFDANGAQIAAFLNKANPDHWSLPAMQNMMTVHLSQVVNLAVDQVKGDYSDAISLYNDYIDHILTGMADMFTQGIAAQYPGDF